MTKLKTIFALSFVFLAGLSAKVAYGQSLFDKSKLGCNPAAPPGKVAATTGSSLPGCGYSNFVILVNRVIDWLIIIGFPLGALFIAYGGFVILSSAGNPERVKKGKQIIIGIITAMIIIGLAYFVIQAVFNVLGVEKSGFGQDLRVQSGIDESKTTLPQ